MARARRNCSRALKADLRNNGNPIRRWRDNWKDIRESSSADVLGGIHETVASVVAFVPFVWSYPVQSQVLPSVQPGVQFDAALRAILTELDTQYGTALKMVF